MIQILKKYRYVLLIAFTYCALIAFFPDVGSKSVDISSRNLMEMLIIVPPIFVLLGLFDEWAPKETIVKLMGERSGVLGIFLSIALGSFSAGPLYAAFPVAVVLMNKGCRFSNILLFVCAWSTTKIPMLLFEASSMGWPFMLLRLSVNIPGIIIVAYALERLACNKEVNSSAKGQTK